MTQPLRIGFDVPFQPFALMIDGKPTTFRAGVQNVFNRDYWSGVASYSTLSQGAPRTLQLSATVDF